MAWEGDEDYTSAARVRNLIAVDREIPDTGRTAVLVDRGPCPEFAASRVRDSFRTVDSVTAIRKQRSHGRNAARGQRPPAYLAARERGRGGGQSATAPK